MALPAVKKQQNRLPAKAVEKDKEEDFFENKKSIVFYPLSDISFTKQLSSE